MDRRVSRFLRELVPLAGFSLALAGGAMAGLVLRESARTQGQMATVDWVVPAVAIGLGALILIASVYHRGLAALAADDDEAAPQDGPAPSPTQRQGRSRLTKFLRARDFLPEQPPDGWTLPLAMKGSNEWMQETKTERIGASWTRRARRSRQAAWTNSFVGWAILDINIYIGHWERGLYQNELAAIRQGSIIRHSSVVLSELRRGARAKRRTGGRRVAFSARSATRMAGTPRSAESFRTTL